MMTSTVRTFIFILVLTVLAALIALPEKIPFNFPSLGISQEITIPRFEFMVLGKRFHNKQQLKRGLDIQGGIQVVLQADMTEIEQSDRQTALDAAKEIILRRVDLFGISEPMVQTSQVGEDYRLIVELPGIDDPDQALELVGQTAQLDFRFQEASPSAEATQSAVSFLTSFIPTGLTGKQLKKANVQFDPQTNDPVIGLEFDAEGSEMFADLTKNNVGKVLAIFIDGYPIAMPKISTPILDGRAVMTGGFSLDEAKQLSIQLNAGALPVSISVLEQRSIGASLGELSIQKSIRAGMIGLGLVMLFMILYYGFNGVIASVALVIYSLLTMATYKLLGVTLTLPGVAGLLLSIGMAVDANILIFERMKEELRVGQPIARAIELGFGRAWDSIKDANLATIMTSLVLINPLDLTFLNSSGLVKGFGVTLLVGVLISLFTGVVVSRTLLRLFLPMLVRKGKQ